MSLPRIARWTPHTLVPNSTDQRRVLVLDDFYDSAEAITMFLSMSGYDTRFVLGGQEVAGAIMAWTPDIAPLDIDMPGMDGFSVARSLRHAHSTRDIVIVAFTAQGSCTVWRSAMAAGFDGYCQKAGAPDVLLHLLSQMSG